MLKILIVDDEAPIREWVEYCIHREKEKFSVAGLAATGEEALQIALKVKPEVVITDIRMPGMDGLKLMKQVKEILPFTVFIILTNYAEFSYAKEAISCGAKEYLLKSEMRVDDLLRILYEIADSKEAIVSSKVEQRLPNGFVDLFNLYQTESEHEKKLFLESMGIKEDVDYQILCADQELLGLTAEAFEEMAEKFNISSVVPASGNGKLFLVAQDGHKYKLRDGLKQIGENLITHYGCGAGVGNCHRKRLEFFEGMKEAVLAVQYNFFTNERTVLEYSVLSGYKELNYEVIRTRFHEILIKLTYKQYMEALTELGQWFDMVTGIRVQDSEWARERCQRLMLAVEEQYYHLNPSGEEEGKNTCGSRSIEECRNWCETLVRKLSDKKNGSYSESIEKALNYIHQNYEKDISLVDVAGQIFRSPEYFSRLFKDEVGENFSTYLMLYRLNAAKQLILKTDMKIAEVSFRVGYSTQSYFSRLYKKYMGKTPEEERGQGKQKS